MGAERKLKVTAFVGEGGRKHRSVEAVATQSCALAMGPHPCGSCDVSGGEQALPRRKEGDGVRSRCTRGHTTISKCQVVEDAGN